MAIPPTRDTLDPGSVENETALTGIRRCTMTLARHDMLGLVLVLLVVPGVSTTTQAQQHVYPGCFGGDVLVWPEVQVDVTFDRVYTGNYNPGQPYDYVTISPDGEGETFADMGITIRLRFTCPSTGWPVVQIPAEEIVLFSNTLCFCEFPTAARPTDADGWTEFTGTIAGGGCAQGLDVYADGVFMATIPVNINSTDSGRVSPCFTDSGDVSLVAEKLGVPGAWEICFDYNESGPPSIDAGDIAFLASHLGASCQ